MLVDKSNLSRPPFQRDSFILFATSGHRLLIVIKFEFRASFSDVQVFVEHDSKYVEWPYTIYHIIPFNVISISGLSDPLL